MTTSILLIDPDISFMVSIKQALEGTGDFRVSLAANGPAAEEALQHGRYDVAVLDFSLPDMDAMELIRLMRQIQPDLAVILCPETPAQHERVRFMDVQGALPKPYAARDLITRVQDVLRKSSAPPSPAAVSPPSPEKTAPPPADEFSPPQMPPELRDLTERKPRPPGKRTTQTELLDEGEREKLMDDLAELDRPGTGALPSDILAEFEAMERAQTGPLREVIAGFDEVDDRPSGTRLFDDEEDEPGGTRVLPDDESPQQTTTQLEWPEEPPETRVLDQPLEPPDTTTLLEWESPPDTSRLDDTSELPPKQPRRGGATVRFQEGGAELQWDGPYELDDETLDVLPDDTFDDLIQEHGWDVGQKRDTKPLGLHPDEPPRKPDDTPSVPQQDLDGVRQFLATDESEHDPSDFGEVLDAVAQSPPTSPRSPQDRVFHELVDSMRMPDDVRPRRTRLEDLLASIAADAPPDEGYGGSDSALDYVLDAIRRGASPAPPDRETPAQPDAKPDDDEVLDDTTIRQVIDGLFDPSFEGVLAALAGEEVPDAEFDEPTYQEPAIDVEPSEDDRFLPDEMTGEDAPDWLTGYDAEGVEPPPDFAAEDSFEPEITEPPVTKEDSAHYPATTALSAVDSTDDDDDFSLNQLLSEIEDQLPPARARRPRLKPLPSWEKSEPVEGMKDVTAMFDHIEGRRREKPSPEEIADAIHDEGPDVFADDRTVVSEQDVPRTIEHMFPDPLTEPPLSTQDTQPSTAWRSEQPAADSADAPAAEEAEDFELPEDIQPPEEWNLGEAMLDQNGEMLSIDDLFALADLPVEAGTEEIEHEHISQRIEAAAEDESVIVDEYDTEDRYGAAELEMADVFSIDDDFDIPDEYRLDDGASADDGVSAEDDVSSTEAGYDAPGFDEYDREPEDEEAITDVFYAGLREAAAESADIQQESYAGGEAEPAEEALFDLDGENLVELTADEAARWLEQLEGVSAEEEPQARDEDVSAMSDIAGITDAFEALDDSGAGEATFAEDYAAVESRDDQRDDDDADLAQMAVMLTQYSLESSAQATMVTRPGEVLAEAGHLSEEAMERLFTIIDMAWHTSTVDSDALIRFITLPDAGEFLLYSKLVDYDLALSMIFHANTPVRTIRRQARRLSESLDLVPEIDEEPLAAKTLVSRPTDPRPPAGLRDAMTHGVPAVTVPPQEEQTPEVFTAYTCLWLPFDPGQELLGDFADDLYMWIQDVAEENAWQLADLDVRSDYIIVSLSAPEKVPPDAIIAHFMDETAHRSAEYYPDIVNGGTLWTDGYYVVSPPRELTEREIARFITYQRQAQLG